MGETDCIGGLNSRVSSVFRLYADKVTGQRAQSSLCLRQTRHCPTGVSAYALPQSVEKVETMCDILATVEMPYRTRGVPQ